MKQLTEAYLLSVLTEIGNRGMEKTYKTFYDACLDCRRLKLAADELQAKINAVGQVKGRSFDQIPADSISWKDRALNDVCHKDELQKRLNDLAAEWQQAYILSARGIIKRSSFKNLPRVTPAQVCEIGKLYFLEAMETADISSVVTLDKRTVSRTLKGLTELLKAPI